MTKYHSDGNTHEAIDKKLLKKIDHLNNSSHEV